MRGPTLRHERVTLGLDMPAVIFRPGGEKACPAIVTVHGGDQSKDVVGPATAAKVLSAGVALVAVDLYLHGEHFDGGAERLGFGYETLLEIVAHSAQELVAAVADLAADEGIIGERIGVRGESLGAYAVLAALGLGASFARALSIAGAADLDATLVHALRQGGAAPDAVARERDRLQPKIAAIDPRGRLEKRSRRPLMMIHGTGDTSVPLDAHRCLYDALAPSYLTADCDCIFVTHNGGHVTPAAVDEIGWDWLIRGLQRS